MFDQFTGRAEITAEFPFTWRNSEEILRLTTYIYPPLPEDTPLNGILLDKFGEIFGKNLKEPGNLEGIADIADLSRRTLEIEAVVDIGRLKGSSYYRVYSWKFSDRPTEQLHHRNPGRTYESKKASELELELSGAKFELANANAKLNMWDEWYRKYLGLNEKLYGEDRLRKGCPVLYEPYDWFSREKIPGNQADCDDMGSVGDYV